MPGRGGQPRSIPALSVTFLRFPSANLKFGTIARIFVRCHRPADKGDNGNVMKTSRPVRADELRSEYHFDYSTAIRGKFYRRLMREGANVAVLEPDVAKVFRTSAAVNQSLRFLLRVSETTRRLTRPSRGRAAGARR